MAEQTGWTQKLLMGCAVLACVQAQPAHATLQPVSLGLEAGTFALPYPALLGVGPVVTLFELVRVGASLGVFEPLAALVTGDRAWVYGASARLRVPSMALSPMLGAGFSRYSVDAPNTALFGRRRSNESWFSPQLGFDWMINDDFFAGGGVALAFRIENGVWTREDLRTVVGSLPASLFAYVGANLF